MLNKVKNLLKINPLGEASFFLLVFSVFLLFESTLSYAQYSQVNTNGNIYTYVNNYSQLNVTTTNASNIASSSANLNALVNGNNLYSTYNLETWFEYGTNTSFGYSTLHNPSNSGYAEFISNISGLSANTIYYFRAVAQNPQGVVYGSTNSFRTNFASTADTQNNTGSSVFNVITIPATSISSTTAQLNSLVFNQNSGSSNTWFEYGTSLVLGDITTPIATGDFPSVKHVNTLTKLAPNTTYYFRAVVVNSSTKSNGSVLSFVTKSGTQNNGEVVKTITSTSYAGPNASLRESIFGASAFGTGSFFPNSIFGWLILLIFILVLVLISKHFYGKFLDKKIP